MAAQQNTHRQHRRKISFADLERTYRAAGPILPPPPHGGQQAHLNAAQVQQQRLEDMRRQDAVRRIRNKPTDRDVPDELSSVIVGDGVERYSNLRDVERQLDAVMMRKRLDIADNLSWRYTRREGVLRVWVSNTVEGQPWQVDEEGGGLNEDGTFEFAESSQATFRVKLEGRLLDDPTADEKEGEAAAKSSSQQRSRFSRFFKSITVDFHRNPALQPDGYSAIEWKKSQPQPGAQTSITDPENPDVGFDTLEFQRKSDENINVTINLMRDEKNERYKLSPQLAEIVDTDEDDRAGVVQGIWEYCRAMGLQEDEDKRSIVCDEPLRKLFGRDTVYFPHVPDYIFPHLQPLPPIQLGYTIRVDKAYIKGSPDADPAIPPSAPTVYDLRVSLPNPLTQQLTRFHNSAAHVSTLRTIVQTDDDLALLVQKIQQTNAKRKFYDNLAKDPTNFVKRWISSQQRDLEVIMAEATRGGGEDGSGEEWRRGGQDGVWGSQLARESVGMWLARNSKAH